LQIQTFILEKKINIMLAARFFDVVRFMHAKR
jgi:hypothetical protein